MANEVSTTTTSSDGNVTITVEKYHKLLEDAAVKPTYDVTQVIKTDAQQALDNQMWGGLLIGAGVCVSFLGSIVYMVGHKQKSKVLNQD